MLRNVIFLCSIVGVFYGCDFQKDRTAQLQLKVDSLTSQIDASNRAAETLLEVGALMDSIDANRNALRTSMVEGTTFDNYKLRMKEINGYVKETQNRIAFLENKVKTLKSSGSNYTATINKMKKELEQRSQEIATLEQQVARYRSENENLIQTVSLQKAEIDDKLNQLRLGNGKIDTLERQVNNLLTESKTDEAESYYARAKAVEETANRTRFAPHKKRSTRKEALELYKLAVFYGKEEARAKVAELEKKI